MKKCISVIFIALLSVLFLLPLALLIVQSLIPSFDAAMVASYTLPVRLFPNPPSVEQFAALVSSRSEYWQTLLLSLVWTIGASVVQTGASIIGGYVLAKQKNRLCSAITVLYCLAMIIPLQVFLLPQYILSDALGALNTPITLYLPLAFAPFGTIFMHEINMKMPDEWVECLRLEGGGFPALLRLVILPFSAPSAAILFLLSFVECWGMVEQPLILLTNKVNNPLSMLLYDMRLGQTSIIFAASLISLLPILAMLLFALLAGRRRSQPA
ncbi:MAG: ABC transporter permease subunit [Eubacteriales bacterium]|nr:ABC transporter permease subunit [Eubacteriales bacterium]MDD3881062.1 ABC transporter permease subunit [Eubacteriales bacterium]MDD4511869.1 ABC transporter permease subunit [Eubacteriales bacterium]